MSGPWEDYQSKSAVVEEDGPWRDFQASSAPQPETVKPEGDKGFLSNVTSDIIKRGTNVYNIAKEKGWSKIPETAALATGQAAGAVADITGEALKSGYKTLMPESAQKAISNGVHKILDTKVGQIGLEAMNEGIEAYRGYKKAYPESAEALEALVNIGSLVPIKKGAQVVKATAKEGVDIGSDVLNAAFPKNPALIDKQMTQVVERGISKAIRPTVVGKQSFPQMQQYYVKAKDAVEKIIENKSALELTDDTGEILKGQLPQTLTQFSHAIDQTKKAVFAQYDEMAKTAGKQGAIVDLTPIARRLNAQISKPLADRHPEMVSYIDDLAKTYAGRKFYTPSETQDAIAMLNQSLESFYKNPSYDSASRAYIDSLIASEMRKSLDNSITKLQGAGYQELKKAYGSLSAIEKDTARRAIVDLRKNTKGLIDFTDIFSVYAGMRGLLRLDPTTIASAGMATYVKHLWSKMNNPNYVVKNLFEDVEKLKTFKDIGYMPKSKLFQQIYKNRKPITEIQPTKYMDETGKAQIDWSYRGEMKGGTQDFIMRPGYDPSIEFKGNIPKQIPLDRPGPSGSSGKSFNLAVEEGRQAGAGMRQPVQHSNLFTKQGFMDKMTSKEVLSQEKTIRTSKPIHQQAFNAESDTLKTWIRKKGGINFNKEQLKGELDHIRENGGQFMVNKNNTGKTLDQLRELAIEDGFLNQDASLNDLLDLIDRDLMVGKTKYGKAVYSVFKEDYWPEKPESGR